jgi:hypothetical protein
MKVVDEHLQAQPESTFQRKAWDAPQVRQFSAGSAEFESAGNDDGPDLS